MLFEHTLCFCLDGELLLRRYANIFRTATCYPFCQRTLSPDVVSLWFAFVVTKAAYLGEEVLQQKNHKNRIKIWMIRYLIEMEFVLCVLWLVSQPLIGVFCYTGRARCATAARYICLFLHVFM